MERISGYSQAAGGFQFNVVGISSLLFVKDVVLLASLSGDVQLSVVQLAAEREAARVRISTSKSETMVLSCKKGGIP